MKRSIQPDLRAPIVAIVIFQLAALLIRAFLEIRLIESGLANSYAHDLSYLIVPPILVCLLYPILRRHGGFLRSLLRCKDLTIHVIFLSILLGISLRAAYWGGLISLVSFGALRNFDPNAVNGFVLSFDCPSPSVLILSFIVAIFLAPVIEETINRGLILPALLHRGRVAAIVISAVLFAVMHNTSAMIVSFIVGVFLGVQLITRKTLWAPLITHATFNGIAVLDWECLSGSWNPTESDDQLFGIGLIATMIALAGLMISIAVVNKRDRGA